MPRGPGFPVLLLWLVACGGAGTQGIDIVQPRDVPVFLGDLGLKSDPGHDPGPADAPDAVPPDGGPADLPCVGGCDIRICTPNERKCTITGIATRCNETGTSVDSEDCSAKKLLCDGGECKPCEPGPPECQGNLRRWCLPDGTIGVQDCGQDFCFEGECRVCVPGDPGCAGNSRAVCNGDGSAWDIVEDCAANDSGLICKDAKCVSLCDLQGPRSNAGCEYWPLDLDQNYEYDAENMQFAVILSNLSAQAPAKVTVYKDGAVEKEVSVPPNDLVILTLDPYSIDTPGIALPERLLSRRLKATSPIVAYQFNPLENVGVFSNDASLLLPTNALGTTYRVMTWRQRADELASYFTLVPVDPGTTQVTLTVTAATVAGNGLDALPAGGTTTVSLLQGQVLHVKATGACADLTGSLVQADRRIAVMGGHECANAPMDKTCGSVPCCCDHLEEQLFPVDAWGQHYLVGQIFNRGKAQDTIRVLAAQDGTKVTVAGATVTVPTLNAGQFHEFRISGHVEITGDKPILVAQIMEGQTSPTGCSETCDDVLFGKKCDGNPFGKNCTTDEDCCPGVAGIGDPSLLLSVPVEQFREDYVFLVPTKYAKNYVNIIAPSGSVVDLDGMPIGSAQFTPIGSGAYAVARLEVQDGVHRLSCTSRINVVVYGWDQYVSYGYAGGMNVNTLVPPL